MKIYGRCSVLCVFCVITPVACCSSPDDPGQRRAIERRQNINREGCVSNENDFYLLQCDNATAYFLLATEWRMANEIIINKLSYFR